MDEVLGQYRSVIASAKKKPQADLQPEQPPPPDPDVVSQPQDSNRQATKKSEKESRKVEPEPKLPEVSKQPEAEPTVKRRGRPATGKRSQDEWIGRTFYIKRETDFDVEELLPQLRRQGVEIDKSELVEMLLSAWVKWQKGENLEIHLSEISPIQKYKNS